MTAFAGWSHAVDDIGSRGLSCRREASEAECAACVKDLELVHVAKLACDYEVRAAGAARFRVSGTVWADVSQACIVTLEPVEDRIEEAFDVEFVPAHAVRAVDGEGEQEVLSGRDVEPIVDGRIDVGRLVFEVVSGALDPYPRKADAELAWRDPKGEGDAASNHPFAALARLRRET